MVGLLRRSGGGNQRGRGQFDPYRCVDHAYTPTRKLQVISLATDQRPRLSLM